MFTPESRIFKMKYLTQTEQFYAKYGGKTGANTCTDETLHPSAELGRVLGCSGHTRYELWLNTPNSTTPRGDARVSRRASALLGVAGHCLALRRLLLCGGPTYLLLLGDRMHKDQADGAVRQ